MRAPSTKTTDKHLALKSMVGIGRGSNKGTGLTQFTKLKLAQKLLDHQPIFDFSNYDLDRHCSGEIYLYYSSYYSNNCNKVLWAIDNDMKEKTLNELDGDLSDLDKWETVVLPILFTGMKCFTSKGGIGSHGHFWVEAGVEYKHYNQFECNTLARDLSSKLEKELERFRKLKGYKFSKVEVKGTNSVMNWRTKDLSLGALCLLPRTDEHVSYVMNEAPVLTFKTIQRLIINLRNYNNAIDNVIPVPDLKEQLVTKVKPTLTAIGSFKTKIVTVDYSYGEFYCDKVLNGNEVRSLDERYIASSEHFGIFISILKALSEADLKMHGEVKQMSFKRIQAMWNALVESGDIELPYNDRLVTVMRNSLSKNGFINWTNNKFCITQACAFSISNEFFLLQNTTTPTCIGIISGHCVHLVPEFDSGVHPTIAHAKKMMELEENILQLCA